MDGSKQVITVGRTRLGRASWMVGVFCSLWVATAWAQDSASPSSNHPSSNPPSSTPPSARSSAVPAVERLSRTLETVAHATPAVRASLDQALASAASLRAEVHTFNPFLELQREGMGTNLDDRPNAAFYVRLGTTLPLPGERHQRSRLEQSLNDWLRAHRVAESTRVVVTAAELWLQLAALEDELTLRRERVERVGRGVELEQARLEQGEVAGLEVVQLRAEHSAERIRLRALEARVSTVREQLRELAGNVVMEVRAGDMSELVAQLPPLPSTAELDSRLIDSPLLQASRADAEKERDLADLRRTLAWGRPEVDVEWERVPSIDGGPSFSAIGFRLHVPLPFGSVGRERQAQAEYEAAAAMSTLRQTELELVRRWRVALEVLDGTSNALGEMEPLQSDLDRVEHSLQEQFRLGEIAHSSLLEGLGRLEDARLSVVEARLALLLARLEVAALLGDGALFPLPPVVVSLPDASP